MSPELLKQVKKLAQEAPKRVPPKRKKRLLAEPYPNYARSLVSQTQANPAVAGLLRALGYVSLGGITGALGGAALSEPENRTRNAAIAGTLSALLTGVPAYISGKKEQESENSRLLFLRRLGIDSPGELEALSAFSPLSNRIAIRGDRI